MLWSGNLWEWSIGSRPPQTLLLPCNQQVLRSASFLFCPKLARAPVSCVLVHCINTLHLIASCTACLTKDNCKAFYFLIFTFQVCLLQSIKALEQQNKCSADDVEAVLLWQKPMQTSKVFLGGMYLLICMRQLALGQLHSCLCLFCSSPATMCNTFTAS